MIQGGREMVGFVLAADDGIDDDDAIKDSINFAWNFVKTLQPK